MDGTDAGDRRGTPRFVPERQRQHGRHGVMQSRGRLRGAAAKGAVVQHARGHERVRQLHEDGAGPSHKDDPFGVHTLDDRHRGPLQ
jgi:hypothetical protein